MAFMRKKFNVTLKRQLSVLAWPILRIILISLIIIVVKMKIDDLFFLFTGFFFLVDILPTIVLHLQYVIKSGKCSVIVDKSSENIELKTSAGETKYRLSEISDLRYIASSAGKGAPAWYAWGHYSYCVIDFQDGNQFVVTCLMSDQLPGSLETLLKIKAENDWPVFPLIRKTKL